MIDKVKILGIIQDGLKDSEDKFVVSVKITPDNRIFVDIDSDNGINIDDCIELSRYIESQMNRDEEDFELNVASAGLDSPLRLTRQYIKNIGRDLSVTMTDGEKIEGELTAANEEEIVVSPMAGRKKVKPEPITIKYADIKVAKLIVKF